MALTFTRTGYNPLGAARPIRGGFGTDIVMTMGEFVFDTSYASGGEALAAADVGLNDIMFILLTPEPSATSTGSGTAAGRGQTMHVQYNYDTAKVMAFGATSGAVGSTSIMEVEVAGTADLSAFTVRFLAFGHSLT